MAISDDLTPLGLPEGSIGQFWPKNDKNPIFEKMSKVICGVSDMVIYVLESETRHPEGLFEDISFLDFRHNFKKLGAIPYCFLAKKWPFWAKKQ